jgi:hypothetical protein
VRSKQNFASCFLALTICSLSQLAAGQVLPADVKPTCTVALTTFKGWFVSAAITPNGGVNPANSVTFVPNSLCSFYQWSEQMFLWLNSPAPSIYGGGARVFDSPVFYDVSDLSGGTRTFIPHVPSVIRPLLLRTAQVGKTGTPVMISQGKLVPLVRPQLGTTGKTLIKNTTGAPVEIAQVKVANGKPVFLDQAGKTINPQVGPNKLPILTDRAGQPVQVQTIRIVNGRPIFLNAAGAVIDIEQGQAGGAGVLIAQNNSLVYFASMVNDVYTYFATGVKDTKIAATQFPTTAANLAAVTAFASAATTPPAFRKTSFPDANALAIEVKTSWIEASGVSTPANYIQMTATIPTYNTSNPALWTPGPTKNATLVMVGMHVVGSVAGHPEMIWSSFEHFGTSPPAAYQYTSTSGTKPGPPSPGPWLFSATSTPPTPNCERADFVSAPNIEASNPGTPCPNNTSIGPSNTERLNAWGTAPVPAPTFIANNTDVLSINNSILGMLAATDIRKNYVFIGATWTIGGAPPSGSNQTGTNQMSNSTLESYQQPSNCFDCHSGNMLGAANGQGLSHMFGPLKALF